MSWLRHFSSPWPLSKTSPPSNCNSFTSFRSSPAALVSHLFQCRASEGGKGRSRWPPSLENVASSQEHKSDFRTMMILSVLKITGLFTGLHTSMFHFTTTDMNCSSILHARGAETVCLHMNDHDPSGQVLFRSSEILWNLLERGNKEVVTAQLGTLECVLYACPPHLRCF